LVAVVERPDAAGGCGGAAAMVTSILVPVRRRGWRLLSRLAAVVSGSPCSAAAAVGSSVGSLPPYKTAECYATAGLSVRHPPCRERDRMPNGPAIGQLVPSASRSSGLFAQPIGLSTRQPRCSSGHPLRCPVKLTSLGGRPVKLTVGLLVIR
jgi:hypothetical protein